MLYLLLNSNFWSNNTIDSLWLKRVVWTILCNFFFVVINNKGLKFTDNPRVYKQLILLLFFLFGEKNCMQSVSFFLLQKSFKTKWVICILFFVFLVLLVFLFGKTKIKKVNSTIWLSLEEILFEKMTLNNFSSWLHNFK